jgi:ABC-type lipoprotein export system ATPase subunit
VALVGPSGSGKTTMLSIPGGFVELTRQHFNGGQDTAALSETDASLCAAKRSVLPFRQQTAAYLTAVRSWN